MSDSTPPTTPISDHLAEKATAAAVAAIEVYNKPDFKYREETFVILLVNAWELLLKAKWLRDHSDDPNSIVEFEPDPSTGSPRPKLNRSGNPITHGLLYLADQLKQSKVPGATKEWYLNLLLVVEARDNAVHFINKDLHFAKRIQEIGTASLRNFLALAQEWCACDLTRFNFFLMPLSFFHGFEAIAPAPVSGYSQQMTRFLAYVKHLEDQGGDPEVSPHHVTLRVETAIVRSREQGALAVRVSNDPNAPVVQLREEDILARYPHDYVSLRDAMKARYSDFIENQRYHELRKPLKADRRYCHRRLLNPKNPKGGVKEFFSPEVFAYFDKHYKRRT